MARRSSDYNRKRNFDITSEPREEARPRGRNKAGALGFVIQKHDARHLHYDFRLELDGTLKSWAVPKARASTPRTSAWPCMSRTTRWAMPISRAHSRRAVRRGDVIVWDRGIWQPHGDPRAAYEAGRLTFTLVGEKLSGDWSLVRTRLRGSGDKEQWLLIKQDDEVARPAEEYDIVSAEPASVLSGADVGSDAPVARPGATRRAAKAGGKARKAAASEERMPDSLAPQLATLVDAPPAGDWHYEIKFDGYRILARIRDGEVRLFTRNGNDWTARLPLQARDLAALELGDSWLDGEVVVLDEDGLPSFQGLQNAFDIGRSHSILYYLFDAPSSMAVTSASCRWRSAVPPWRRCSRASGAACCASEAFSASHESILESACSMSLEGVIGKRAGSPYRSARSPDWIKLVPPAPGVRDRRLHRTQGQPQRFRRLAAGRP